jgi:hypothetical protein
MTPAAPKPPLRNAPCSCGSGKKYKHCCGLAAGTAAEPVGAGATKSRRDVWLIAIGLAALIAVTIFALVSVNRRPAARPGEVTSLLPGGRMPKAWEFDAANNRHWDPGHNHWHDGPPPAGAEKADAAAAAAAAAVGK